MLTVCDPMDCSPPVSSVCGILKARTLEWVAISSFRGSSWPTGWMCISFISCISRWSLYHWASWEAHTYTYIQLQTPTNAEAQFSIKQCFLNINIPISHLGMLLQFRFWFSKPGIGPQILNFYHLTGFIAVAGPWADPGMEPESPAFSSVQFSHSVMSDSLQSHGLLPCPSPTPRACSNSCPTSWWCHPTISSSVFPFSPCL